jgi:hypothetical protein
MSVNFTKEQDLDELDQSSLKSLQDTFFENKQGHHNIMDEKTQEHSSSTYSNTKEGASLSRPKRPLSAYNLFFRDQRKRLLRELPAVKHQGRGHGKIGFKDLGKIIGFKWRAVSAEEKKVYEEMAAEHRKVYLASVKVWKKEMEARGLSTKRPKKVVCGPVPGKSVSTGSMDLMDQPSLTSLMVSVSPESLLGGFDATNNLHAVDYGIVVRQQQGRAHYLQTCGDRSSRGADDKFITNTPFNVVFSTQESQGNLISGFPLETHEITSSFMRTFEASSQMFRMRNHPMNVYAINNCVPGSYNEIGQGNVPEDAILHGESVEPLPYNTGKNTEHEELVGLANRMNKEDINLFVSMFKSP